MELLFILIFLAIILFIIFFVKIKKYPFFKEEKDMEHKREIRSYRANELYKRIYNTPFIGICDYFGFQEKLKILEEKEKMEKMEELEYLEKQNKKWYNKLLKRKIQ